MRSRIMNYILIVSVVPFLFFCSNDDGGTQPVIPPDQRELPEELNILEVSIPQNLIDATFGSNVGAIETRSALEVLNSLDHFYQSMLPPDEILRLNKSQSFEPKVWNWQEENLHISLEYEDSETEWNIAQYYNGKDGLGTNYDNFLRGKLIKSTEIFNGELKLYQFGSSRPVISYEWFVDPVLGKKIRVNYNNTLHFTYTLHNPQAGASTIDLVDGRYNLRIFINPNGTGTWSEFDHTGKIVDRGSW